MRSSRSLSSLYLFIGGLILISFLSGCSASKPSIVGTWEPTVPNTLPVPGIDSITWNFDSNNKVYTNTAGSGTYTLIGEDQIQINTDNVAINTIAKYKISDDILTLEYPGGRIYAYKRLK